MIDRDALAARQEEWCWWCGGRLGAAFAVHHRQLRSQGGDDDPSNLIAVHHGCHNTGTDSIHLNIFTALDRGFIVNSWDAPSKIPLSTPLGPVTLARGGTITQGEKHEW